MSVLNEPIPNKLSINISFPCGRVSYNVRLTACISKEFFEIPISISSIPNLKANPNILLIISSFIYINCNFVVLIFFAEEVRV